MLKKINSFRTLLAYVRSSASSLLNNAFLARCGSMMLVGPSGSGKSKLKDWIVCAMACGQELFDIRPSRPLKVLSIQSEDTDEDTAESYQGYASQEVGGDKATLDLINSNLVAITLIGVDGPEFIKEVDILCEKYKPDVIVIDPILSYIGCDVVDQKGVTAFFRKGLLPVMMKHKCALFAVHHSPKNAKGAALIDRAIGSMEFSAFFRGILDISYAEGKPNELTLAVAKRQRQMEWKDKDGQPTHLKYLLKGTSGVSFIEVSGFEPGSIKIGGRPAKANRAEIMSVIKSSQKAGKSKDEIVELIAQKFEYSLKQAQRYVNSAAAVAPASVEAPPETMEEPVVDNPQSEMTIEELEESMGLRR